MYVHVCSWLARSLSLLTDGTLRQSSHLHKQFVGYIAAQVARGLLAREGAHEGGVIHWNARLLVVLYLLQHRTIRSHRHMLLLLKKKKT